MCSRGKKTYSVSVNFSGGAQSFPNVAPPSEFTFLSKTEENVFLRNTIH